jgi:hypothetical protein
MRSTIRPVCLAIKDFLFARSNEGGKGALPDTAVLPDDDDGQSMLAAEVVGPVFGYPEDARYLRHIEQAVLPIRGRARAAQDAHLDKNLRLPEPAGERR